MKERIAYIDALRGFTMILVVLEHVFTFSLDLKNCFLSEFFQTFSMPMFFFISGFIACKPIETWDKSFCLKMLKKKALVQLVPMTFFFALYSYTLANGPTNEFLRAGFGKFWFTLVLFEMFCIYCATSFLAKHTFHKFFDAGMIIISLGGLYFALGPEHSKSFIKFLSLYNLGYYLQYFTLGLICRKYLKQFLNLICNENCKAIALLTFILLALIDLGPFNTLVPYPVLAIVHVVLIHYIAVFVVFAFFKSNESYLSKNGHFQQGLIFIGRRTLDIYLIHYFFLPDLTSFTKCIHEDNMLVVQLITAGFLALAIIAVSLLCSEVIRSSNTLAYYILGAKRQ